MLWARQLQAEHRIWPDVVAAEPVRKAGSQSDEHQAQGSLDPSPCGSVLPPAAPGELVLRLAQSSQPADGHSG